MEECSPEHPPHPPSERGLKAAAGKRWKWGVSARTEEKRKTGEKGTGREQRSKGRCRVWQKDKWGEGSQASSKRKESGKNQTEDWKPGMRGMGKAGEQRMGAARARGHVPGGKQEARKWEGKNWRQDGKKQRNVKVWQANECGRQAGTVTCPWP